MSGVFGDRRDMGNKRRYKYRQCPKCKKVFPAGEFEPVDIFEGEPWHSDFQRICPGCGYRDSTANFLVVGKPTREPGEDKI